MGRRCGGDSSASKAEAEERQERRQSHTTADGGETVSEAASAICAESRDTEADRVPTQTGKDADDGQEQRKSDSAWSWAGGAKSVLQPGRPAKARDAEADAECVATSRTVDRAGCTPKCT